MRLVVFLGCVYLLAACNYRFSKDPIPSLPVIDEEFKTNASDYLDQLIKEDPENIDLYLEKLKFYRNQNWPTESISTINAAIQLDSSNLELFKYREEYFLTNGNYRNALKDINHLLKKDYQDPILKVDAANVLFKLNRITEAGVVLENPLVRNIDDPRVPQLKGEISLAKGDTLFAIRQFYLSYLNGESNDEINTKLINLLLEIQEYGRLDQLLSGLIQQDSSYLMQFVEVKLQVGRAAEAKPIVEDMVAKGNINALQILSDYFYQRGIYDSVVYYNELYVAQYDSSNQAFINIGRAMDRKGWWTKALQYYDLVLQTDPSNKDALAETQKVKGKIAYLRKLKEERENAPATTELPKKKLDF